jgi:hypothetical protein
MTHAIERSEPGISGRFSGGLPSTRDIGMALVAAVLIVAGIALGVLMLDAFNEIAAKGFASLA